MNYYKKSAIQFCKKYNIDHPTADNLKSAVKKCGYKLVYFSNIVNKPEIEELLIALDLLEFSKTEKAFTYADKNNRILFLCNNLSDDEAQILLSHELGHIYLNHLAKKSNLLGTDITCEKEANEFAHYLTDYKSFPDFLKLKNIKKKYIITAVALIVLIAGSLIIYSSNNNDSQLYYATKTGSKYHDKNCIHIIDKDDIIADTEKNFKKKNYEPCKLCLPDKNK